MFYDRVQSNPHVTTVLVDSRMLCLMQHNKWCYACLPKINISNLKKTPLFYKEWKWSFIEQ